MGKERLRIRVLRDRNQGVRKLFLKLAWSMTREPKLARMQLERREMLEVEDTDMRVLRESKVTESQFQEWGLTIAWLTNMGRRKMRVIRWRNGELGDRHMGGAIVIFSMIRGRIWGQEAFERAGGTFKSQHSICNLGCE
jgi:hypothetical protein